MPEVDDTVMIYFPTEEEKEKARQEYLDRKGIHSSFRW